MNVSQYAREVFEIESKAIYNLIEKLDEQFDMAVNMILNMEGKVIVTGMGKSGLIGKKIAATFVSTGTNAYFMHPGEAYHGDLGMVSENDIILALSGSGETDEILKLIPFFKENRNPVIAITGRKNSQLAKNASVHLNVAIDTEACPLNLAPTTSTTVALSMGDALSVALMRARNFDSESFARLHPGGTLGKRLVTTAAEMMHSDYLPVVKSASGTKEIIHVVSKGRLGLAVITDDELNVQGIVTDGDIRRGMEKNEESFFSLTAKDLATFDPKCVTPETKLTEVEAKMNQYLINSLLVTEKNKLVGVIQIYDLP